MRAFSPRLIVIPLFILASAQTAPQQPPDLRESEDVANRIFAARIKRAKVVQFRASDVPKNAFSDKEFARDKNDKPPQNVTPDRRSEERRVGKECRRQ